jgi:F1F0 ATPase subunit 2
MSEVPRLLLSLISGALLGAMFFAGLRWTVSMLTTARYAALLAPASFVVRAGILLVGFYLVSGPHWERLAACLLGFFIGRVAMLRHTLTASQFRPQAVGEPEHAP